MRASQRTEIEVEVEAMDELAKEVLWLRVLLDEMGYPVSGLTVIYTDSVNGIDQFGVYKNNVKGRHYCRDLNFLRGLSKEDGNLCNSLNWKGGSVTDAWRLSRGM
ncbi:hypothetical protein B484DRAFT_405739 [Ochromonadaceae sp. CCMP2298]|nr:hypothetical protein B484DRAFT_405739 [Ochromonadaceae sp. CCMP2298]